MKRLPGIMLRYVLVFYIPWTTTLLSVDAQVRLGCAEVEYLEVGKEGVVICSFEDFYSVTWYTKEDYDAKKSPLIHFNGNNDGLTAEYDVYPNGSFIIRNVTFNHSGRYIVTMLYDVTSNLVVHEVRVEVYVVPDPPYPVVEGHIQQHVYMDVNRDGELSCSMRGVYPNVSLTLTVLDPSQGNKIQFQHDGIGAHKTQNEDGTYDITLSSMFRVTDHSLRRITIQCGVANEIGEYLSAKTKVDLLFPAGHPVVNGDNEHQHVFLDTQREGQLTCNKKNARSNASLVWEVLDTELKDKITFRSDRFVRRINEDDTVDIYLTSQYIVNDDSIDRITIQCKEIGPSADEYPSVTLVDLLFPANAPSVPVIDGCYSKQDNCLLKVQRTGELACAVKNSFEPVHLQWKILDVVDLQPVFAFKKQRDVSSNESGTFDVSITTPFSVKNNSLDSLTVECGAFTARNGIRTASSRVHLLFEGAPAQVVVDGCYSQHPQCTLKVDNKGTLTCSVRDSPYLVDLKWKSILEEPSSMLFHDEKSTVTKHVGDTFDQSTTVSYNITDSFLKQARVECEAYEHDSDILYSKSSVLLTFKNADDPYINHMNNELRNLVLVHVIFLLVVLLWLLILTLGIVGKKRKLHWMKKKVWHPHSEHAGTSQRERTNVHNQDQGQNLLQCQENGATSTNKGLTQIILGVFQKMLEKLVSSESDIEALLGNEFRSENGEGSNREIKDETKM